MESDNGSNNVSISILKNEIEKALDLMGKENNMSTHVDWDDYFSHQGLVQSESCGKMQFRVAIIVKKDAENKEVEDSSKLDSQRSSPCIMFHSIKLFKEVVTKNCKLNKTKVKKSLTLHTICCTFFLDMIGI